MMSPGDEDPFLQVQQDVQTQLQTTRGLFSSYMRIRSLQQSSSTESPELAAAKADILAALEDLREDVSDLAGAVRAAERDPSSFGLDGMEVSRRRRLVVEAAGEVDDMMEEVEKDGASSGQKGQGGQNQDPFGRGRHTSVSGLPDPSAFAMDDADLVRGGGGGGGGGSTDYARQFEHQTQEQILREQDVELDSVYVTVGNLRNMADDMGRELNEQTEMLDQTDTLVDRVNDRLQDGMGKMKHIIRKNENGLSSCCIGVLIVVLIILLVLLLLF